jgi:hypothetical protein
MEVGNLSQRATLGISTTVLDSDLCWPAQVQLPAVGRPMLASHYGTGVTKVRHGNFKLEGILRTSLVEGTNIRSSINLVDTGYAFFGCSWSTRRQK